MYWYLHVFTTIIEVHKTWSVVKRSANLRNLCTAWLRSHEKSLLTQPPGPLGLEWSDAKRCGEIHGENACLACRWWGPIPCWNMECRFILWIRSRIKLFCDSVDHGCFFWLICSLYVVRNRSFAGNVYGVYAICSASQPKKIFIVGNVWYW